MSAVDFFDSNVLVYVFDTRDPRRSSIAQGLLAHAQREHNAVISAQVVQDVRSNMGDAVYETIIPRNVRLAEAPSHGTPVMYYDKSSLGSKAYLGLAGELLRREEQQQKAEASA